MKRELVAAIIIRDARLLLVHNVKSASVRLEPPGGKRHDGEDRESAVLREVQEELDIKARVSGFFGVYDTDSPEGAFKVHMYLCDIVSGSPRLAEPEKISAFGWYSFSELVKLRDTGALVPNLSSALEQIGERLEATIK